MTPHSPPLGSGPHLWMRRRGSEAAVGEAPAQPGGLWDPVCGHQVCTIPCPASRPEPQLPGMTLVHFRGSEGDGGKRRGCLPWSELQALTPMKSSVYSAHSRSGAGGCFTGAQRSPGAVSGRHGPRWRLSWGPLTSSPCPQGAFLPHHSYKGAPFLIELFSWVVSIE